MARGWLWSRMIPEGDAARVCVDVLQALQQELGPGKGKTGQSPVAVWWTQQDQSELVGRPPTRLPGLPHRT